MLPGFPVQFFYYRQISADNAGAMTLRFLQVWSTRRASAPASTPAASGSATSGGATAHGVEAAVTAVPDTAGGATGSATAVIAATLLVLSAGWTRRRRLRRIRTGR
jgi:hypothetical protein